MFTILIPVFRTGFLESQLHWLAKQKFKDFTVLAMDARYKSNRNQPFALRKYPFQFHHVPMVHNTLMAKRFDLSVYNNLALLSPTFHFIFLSDTSYPVPGFTEAVAKSLFRLDSEPGVFYSYTANIAGYDRSNHTVDLRVESKLETHRATVLTDKSMFIHVLNGMDEATTAAYSPYTLFPSPHSVRGLPGPERLLYHFDMSHPVMDIDLWQQPCKKCGPVFSVAALTTATSADDFMRRAPDREVVDQMTFFEPEIEAMMFQCPNCGFGGVLSPLEYRRQSERSYAIAAPTGLLDGRAGRNLVDVYDTMSRKVINSMDARLAFLRSSY